MFNIKKILSAIVVICGVLFISENVFASSNLIPIDLSNGIKISVPQDWDYLQGNYLLPGQVLAGRMTDKGTYATISVVITANHDRPLSSWNQNDLDSFDNSLYQGLQKDLHNTITKWEGTASSKINGKTVLITTYIRSSPIHGSVVVIMNHYIESGKDIVVTLSFKESDNLLWKSTIIGIMKSVRIN